MSYASAPSLNNAMHVTLLQALAKVCRYHSTAACSGILLLLVMLSASNPHAHAEPPPRGAANPIYMSHQPPTSPALLVLICPLAAWCPAKVRLRCMTSYISDETCSCYCCCDRRCYAAISCCSDSILVLLCLQASDGSNCLAQAHLLCGWLS